VPVDVDTTYTLDSVRSTNFFNGRLLSGEDLTQERAATRALLERLGRACGEGVAYGLEVKKHAVRGDPRPFLSVSAGLAINRRGETLELKREVAVALLPEAATASRRKGAGPGRSGAGDFGRCRAPAGTYLANRGVYLFVMRPAQDLEGSAPASGLGDIDSPCTADTIADGVLFHFERLEEPELPAGVLADEARLRNRVAHLCFGTEDPRRTAWIRDPFGVRSEVYGLLDDLRGAKLHDGDVPLALFYWKEGAVGEPGRVEFVDMWSVRRRPARVGFGGPLTPEIADRTRVEGEAMILQFQEELAAIAEAERANVAAAARFAWLPPVGALPLSRAGAPRGYSDARFFSGMKARSLAFVEGAPVPALVAHALLLPPISTTAGEFIWLYAVRENLQSAGVPYVLFASGAAPYFGNARFDLARWNYSSFAEV
jgi:hypothetical protein